MDSPHTHLVLGLCLASPLPEPQQLCQKRGRLLRRASVPEGPWGSLLTLPPKLVTVARGLVGLGARRQPCLQGSAVSAPQGWSRSRCSPGSECGLSGPCRGHRAQKNSPGSCFSPDPELMEKGSDRTGPRAWPGCRRVVRCVLGQRGGRALQFTWNWQPQPIIKEAVEKSKGNGRCWGRGLSLCPHT